MGEYHYGQTIREYRLACNMTLSELASLWPSKDTGVTSRYVSDIERGVKHIGDMQVLRELASILHIPLWKLGLSEFNPFQEMQDVSPLFDMESLKQLIDDIWIIRVNMPLSLVEEKVKKLAAIISRLLEHTPRLMENKDFLLLYAQVKRLQEVIYTEKHQYAMSLKLAYEMVELAIMTEILSCRAISLVRVGIELLRDEKKEALEYLEKAKDMSFETHSKEVMAYCFAMLARGYVTFEEKIKFERAIDTALTLGDSMRGLPVATKDYVFHAYSAILEEKSNGFILLNEGDKALEMLPGIEREATSEHNSYLKMWLPLDYAQGYMCLGEIEESIKRLWNFYESIQGYNSERITSRVNNHLSDLESLGYGELPEVRSFREMLTASDH